MPTESPLEAIAMKLRRAFLPFICVPVANTGENKITFLVSGHDAHTIGRGEVLPSQSFSPESLRDTVIGIRDNIARQHGIRFEPLPDDF